MQEDEKIRLSEISKVSVFSRPLLEEKCMRGSISIDKIAFSRNCNIKTIIASRMLLFRLCLSLKIATRLK